MTLPRSGSGIARDGLGRERATLEHEFTPEETAVVKEKGRTLVSDLLHTKKGHWGGLSKSKREIESKSSNSLEKSDNNVDDASAVVSPAPTPAAGPASAEALLVQHRIDTLAESGNKSYKNKSYVAAIADFKHFFTQIERSSPNLGLAEKNLDRIADMHWKLGEMYEEMLNLPLAMDHYCDSLSALKECKEKGTEKAQKADLDEKIGIVLSSMGRLQNKLGNYDYALELHNAAFGITSPPLLSRQSRSFKRRLKFSDSTIFSFESFLSDHESIISSDSMTSSRWSRHDTIKLVQNIGCGVGENANESFSIIHCLTSDIMNLFGIADDESTIATYDTYDSWRAERERSAAQKKESRKRSTNTKDVSSKFSGSSSEYQTGEILDERDDQVAAKATIIESREVGYTESKSSMPQEPLSTLTVVEEVDATEARTENSPPQNGNDVTKKYPPTIYSP